MSNYDVTFADVIHAYIFELLNLPIFFFSIVFERTIQGKLKAEKKFSKSQI